MEALTLTDEISNQKSFVSVGDKKHQDAEQVLTLTRILLYTFKIARLDLFQKCLLPKENILPSYFFSSECDEETDQTQCSKHANCVCRM